MPGLNGRLKKIESIISEIATTNDPYKGWRRCRELELFRKFPWALRVYLIADKPWVEWASNEIKAAWGFDYFVSGYFKRFFEIDLTSPPSREDKEYKSHWTNPDGLDDIPTLEAQGMWSNLGIYEFYDRFFEYIETRLARRSEE